MSQMKLSEMLNNKKKTNKQNKSTELQGDNLFIAEGNVLCSGIRCKRLTYGEIT